MGLLERSASATTPIGRSASTTGRAADIVLTHQLHGLEDIRRRDDWLRAGPEARISTSDLFHPQSLDGRRRPDAGRVYRRTRLAGTGAVNRLAFTKVRQELVVHEAIEEEIFYSALKDHPKTKEIALEAYEEHHVVDMVMAEIDGVAYDDEKWGAKFKVMKENLEHHIEEKRVRCSGRPSRCSTRTSSLSSASTWRHVRKS